LALSACVQSADRQTDGEHGTMVFRASLEEKTALPGSLFMAPSTALPAHLRQYGAGSVTGKPDRVSGIAYRIVILGTMPPC